MSFSISKNFLNPKYSTDNVRRYHFNVGQIFDIEPISAKIGPILRRLQVVSWEERFN